jgi:hypothetical protein
LWQNGCLNINFVLKNKKKIYFGVLERFDEHFLGNFVSVLKVVNWAMGMPLQTNRWLLGFCNEKILGVGLIFPSLAVAPFKGKGRVFKFC